MIAFFANIFGYILNFLYELVHNYGLAIILFSILVKLLMLPLSIKQQKTMKKNEKLQEEMKKIQFKYKNDPEKLNQETMELYKRENINPFGGCFSSIVQIILLFAVFYLVRSPLTYMKKIDTSVIEEYKSIAVTNNNDTSYPEIAIIRYVRNLDESKVNENSQNEDIQVEENNNQENANEQVEDSENKAGLTESELSKYNDEININMEFLGLDLSKIPTQDLTDLKVFVIPVLYVISSFISIQLSTSMQNRKKKNTQNEEEKDAEYDAVAQANKSMSWMMPIMSISIACIAPLGLALYWLVNNILMILERLILNKFIKDEEEEQNG